MANRYRKSIILSTCAHKWRLIENVKGVWYTETIKGLIRVSVGSAEKRAEQ